MKQYTTPTQTAKLIELGFDKPKSIGGYEPTFVVEYEGVEVSNVIIGENKQCPIFAYSIGELIDILPKSLKNPYNPPLAIECNEKWRVYYGVQEDYSWEWIIFYEEERNELIDALYDMCIILKKKGVI